MNTELLELSLNNKQLLSRVTEKPFDRSKNHLTTLKTNMDSQLMWGDSPNPGDFSVL